MGMDNREDIGMSFRMEPTASRANHALTPIGQTMTLSSSGCMMSEWSWSSSPAMSRMLGSTMPGLCAGARDNLKIQIELPADANTLELREPSQSLAFMSKMKAWCRVPGPDGTTEAF